MKLTCPQCRITIDIESLESLNKHLVDVEHKICNFDDSNIEIDSEKRKQFNELAIDFRDTLVKIKLYDK